MEPARIRELMKRLIDSTKAGKLSWEETADENTFRLILDVGIIHIQQVERQSDGDFRLSLLNENNAIVEVFEGGKAEDNHLLRALYETARFSALRANDFFRQLEQEVIRRSI